MCVCMCALHIIYLYVHTNVYNLYYTFIHTFHKIYTYICLQELPLEDAQVVVLSREEERIEG